LQRQSSDSGGRAACRDVGVPVCKTLTRRWCSWSGQVENMAPSDEKATGLSNYANAPQPLPSSITGWRPRMLRMVGGGWNPYTDHTRTARGAEAWRSWPSRPREGAPLAGALPLPHLVPLRATAVSDARCYTLLPVQRGATCSRRERPSNIPAGVLSPVLRYARGIETFWGIQPPGGILEVRGACLSTPPFVTVDRVHEGVSCHGHPPVVPQ
jgi:hypothetical protein